VGGNTIERLGEGAVHFRTSPVRPVVTSKEMHKVFVELRRRASPCSGCLYSSSVCGAVLDRSISEICLALTTALSS
jgi:hypothetical protein